MEDTWQSHCPSTWAHPQPPTAALPPELPPTPAPAPMNMNSHSPLSAIAQQQTYPCVRRAGQAPTICNSLGSGPSLSGKPLAANPILALLSGDLQHLPKSFAGLQNSASASGRTRSPVPIDIVKASSGIEMMHVAPPSRIHVSGAAMNPEVTRFASSAPLPVSNGSILTMHNDIQVVDFNAHNSALTRTAILQGTQPNDTEFPVSSRSHSWLDARERSNGSLHPMNLRTSKGMHEARSLKSASHSASLSSRNSEFHTGRPRVFCLNTVGELFLSDVGLLGAICFCHGSSMTLAEFCEHSGSASSNPSDAAYLENGMTVSQWCKLSFGLRAADDSIQSDRPNSNSAKVLVHLPKTSSPTPSPKDLGALKSIEAFNLGKSSGSSNTFVHNDHSHQASAGSFYLEKLEKYMGYPHQQIKLDGPDMFKNLRRSVQDDFPDLHSSHTASNVREGPVMLSFGTSHAATTLGSPNIRHHSAGNSLSYGIINPPKSSSYLGVKTFATHNSTSKNSNYPPIPFVTDRVAGSSTTELRLGQPTPHNDAQLGSGLDAKHSQHTGVSGDQQKPQYHQVKQKGFLPMETKELRENLPDALTRPLRFGQADRTGLQHINGSSSTSDGSASEYCKPSGLTLHHRNGSFSASNPSESEDCRSKNSAISLFLSHLNYIDASKLSCTDNIFNEAEQFTSQEHIISNDSDKGKGLRGAESGSCNALEESYLAQQTGTDFNICSACNAGVSKHKTLSTDSAKSSFHFGESRHQAWHSNMNEKKDCCNHPSHAARELVPCMAPKPCPLKSSAFTSHSPSTPPHSLKPNSALFYVKDTDVNPHLLDGRLRCLSSGNVSELCEENPSSLEASHGHVKTCCLSTSRLHRNLCKDGSLSSEEVRQAPKCTGKQDVSNFAVRSAELCSKCHCSDNGRVTCSDIYHKCTTAEERIRLYPEESDNKLLGCHFCCSCKKNLLGTADNTAGDSIQNDHHQKKMHNPTFTGDCRCTVYSRCPTGCCPSGDGPCYPYNEPSICHKENSITITIPYDSRHMFSDGKMVKLDQCGCLKKHASLNKGHHSSIWRDVNGKKLGCSDSAVIQKPPKSIDASGNVVVREHERIKEQQMSNVCSGSSAPELTELSFEMTNVSNLNHVPDSAVDEGSRIEKCSSSEEVLESTALEGAISHNPRTSTTNLSENISTKEKDVKIQMNMASGIQVSLMQKENTARERKTKGPEKWKKLNRMIHVSDFTTMDSDSTKTTKCHFKKNKVRVGPKNKEVRASPFNMLSTKKKRSAVLTKFLPSKRLRIHQKINECDEMILSDDDRMPKVVKLLALQKVEGGLAANGEVPLEQVKDDFISPEKPPKYISLGFVGNSPECGKDICNLKVRPIVCGNSGIISSLQGDQQKPVKMASISMILKTAKRCTVGKQPSIFENKGGRGNAKDKYGKELSSQKNYENKCCTTGLRNGQEASDLLSPGVNEKHFNKDHECFIEGNIFGGVEVSGCGHDLECNKQHEYSDSLPANREAQESSIKMLLGDTKSMQKVPCLSTVQETSNPKKSGVKLKGLSSCNEENLVVREPTSRKLRSKKVLHFPAIRQGRVIRHNKHDHEHCLRNSRSRGSECGPDFDSAVFCCVCGSSNKEEGNCLLECYNCFIRVHQACYGIPKVTKGHWFCRPCKSNSKSIVCVLCGYGGGALTRAIKSRKIVKSLLKAWKIGTDNESLTSLSSARSIVDVDEKLSSVGVEAEDFGENGSCPRMGSSSSGEVCEDLLNEGTCKRKHTTFQQDDLQQDIQPYNSITAGVLDPSVSQWVHMVCGLWTPGTKCPNVDTMSTFDVSGAYPARKNTVCSICNRDGGSCIRCRIPSCSVHFHPWCAHQKGLLQSEVEGAANDKVGFYGRCVFHTTHKTQQDDSLVEAEASNPVNKDFSSARTEGYQGRKREEGYRENLKKLHKNVAGCNVSQDQINAWFHINGQKSCTREIFNSLSSDVESDFRKEYMRFKQAKGWRHLVVYKSGIHALGLYTSRFIPCGAMVVEYVGEIVGLRVADKREIEYQTGRKIQYKSACYFFRIDKEHIIDATRKGGIARFVNHSCLPNCIAKVISIRNEKKVVFFAERDINPGEEITYDYHFNREDEGKKIPCFCNSKNCRRYLN